MNAATPQFHHSGYNSDEGGAPVLRPRVIDTSGISRRFYPMTDAPRVRGGKRGFIVVNSQAIYGIALKSSQFIAD